jgi:hypothetical protein
MSAAPNALIAFRLVPFGSALTSAVVADRKPWQATAAAGALPGTLEVVDAAVGVLLPLALVLALPHAASESRTVVPIAAAVSAITFFI